MLCDVTVDDLNWSKLPYSSCHVAVSPVYMLKFAPRLYSFHFTVRNGELTRINNFQHPDSEVSTAQPIIHPPKAQCGFHGRRDRVCQCDSLPGSSSQNRLKSLKHESKLVEISLAGLISLITKASFSSSPSYFSKVLAGAGISNRMKLQSWLSNSSCTPVSPHPPHLPSPFTLPASFRPLPLKLKYGLNLMLWTLKTRRPLAAENFQTNDDKVSMTRWFKAIS